MSSEGLGLVVKAHTALYRATLGSKVIKKMKFRGLLRGGCPNLLRAELADEVVEEVVQAQGSLLRV